MMRGMTILWAVLAVIIGIGLFLLKYEVRTLEGQLAGINRDIRANQEAIHVLRAEWSYLNDPERLRELNERHLGMKPFRGEQLANIADLPMAPPRPGDEPAPPATPTPDSRVMAEAPPTAPAAPLTRSLRPTPAPAPAASAPAPTPAPPVARSEPPRTVVASAPAKPQPLKTETTPRPIVTKSEPVRSEALQSAFAAAKPANPKPVTTTPSPAYRPLPATPTKLPTGGVVSQNPAGDVMVIKSPALIAAEAAAGGKR